MLPTGAGCGGPSNSACDNFKLSIRPFTGSFRVEITLTPQLVSDYDLEVYGPGSELLGSSGNLPSQVERVVLNNPPAGDYTVTGVPFSVATGYTATAKAIDQPGAGTSTEVSPNYTNYPAPAPLGQGAGEPTLGVNEATGAVMFIAGTETLKVTFNDAVKGAPATWSDKSGPTTSLITFDPILFTDQATGRTFASQLLPTKVSLMAFTDDDGQNWTPSQGTGITSGVDHQSVGGGPFAPGLIGPLTAYPNAVYYCSQDIALANCAVSQTGGLTFLPAVPIYTLLECNGLHGHIKVAPDGSAYVPNKSCQGEQGVAASTDSGLTWAVKKVPGSSSGNWDPSVGTATDGTLYFGYANGDGHPWVAVSQDGGDTWAHMQDVGLSHGIKNIAFPAVVAGDPDRAAFAFLGTTKEGDVYGEDPSLNAVWHLYVAHTYDGGATWVTTNATPTDPVQRGTICNAGTLCGSTRNLLDFMDATTDAQGRVLVGYADGCIGPCVAGGANSGTDVGTIARQATGKGVYAEFDP